MIHIKEYPSQSRLKELFDYKDGELFWKHRPISEFKTKSAHASANARVEGKKLFCRIQRGYKITMISKSNFRHHRLVYIWHHGDLLPSQEIDHIDNNRLNNNISNLRIANRSNNMRNKEIGANNKSGIKGVSWCSTRNKWQVQLGTHPNKITKLFTSKYDAEKFLRSKREQLHGEFHNHG